MPRTMIIYLLVLRIKSLCDELHNLMKYIHFDENERYTKLALTELEGAPEFSNAIVLALSATPAPIFEHMRGTLYRVPIDTSQLYHYIENTTSTFTSIEKFARQQVCGVKGIIYTDHITKLKTLKSIIQENGLSAIPIWSISNATHPMREEQLAAREYLLREEAIPPEYDILLINASCETGITLRGDIGYFAIDSRNPITQTQVRCRYRSDLDRLYLLAPYGDEDFLVPADYMGRKLSAKEKQQLCELLHIPNPKGGIYHWQTVADRLLEKGYHITDGKNKKGRFSLITK